MTSSPTASPASAHPSIGDRLAWFQAAADGSAPTLARLLDAGHPINDLDDLGGSSWVGGRIYGASAAMVCASRGHAECLLLLVSAGCDIDMLDHNRISPACYAASMDQAECLRILIDSGACIDTMGPAGVDERNQRDPAFYASFQNGHKCLDLLLRADPGIFSKARAWRYPLGQAAAVHGSMDCLRLLLAAGWDARETDGLGRTSAMMAAQQGHVDLLLTLADHGCDLEAVDHAGKAAWDYPGMENGEPESQGVVRAAIDKWLIERATREPARALTSAPLRL